MTEKPRRPRPPGAPWPKRRPPDRRPARTGGVRPPRPAQGDEALVIFGLHAVEAALANPRRKISKLWLTENAERRLEAGVTARGLAVERVSPRELDRRLGSDTVHQGALVEVEPLADLTLEELIANGEGRPILALDQVTDPHNVGAVLRSAAVFGAHGLIMTRRHSPPLGGALAKAASGAVDLVRIALVQNLARALDELKAEGYRVIGLDGAATEGLEAADLGGRVVLVLGAEGKGLRQLTKDTCGTLCRIEADGALASLNVSNAAAIALHFAAFRRRHA